MSSWKSMANQSAQDVPVPSEVETPPKEMRVPDIPTELAQAIEETFHNMNVAVEEQLAASEEPAAEGSASGEAQ